MQVNFVYDLWAILCIKILDQNASCKYVEILMLQDMLHHSGMYKTLKIMGYTTNLTG